MKFTLTLEEQGDEIVVKAEFDEPLPAEAMGAGDAVNDQDKQREAIENLHQVHYLGLHCLRILDELSEKVTVERAE